MPVFVSPIPKLKVLIGADMFGIIDHAEWLKSPSNESEKITAALTNGALNRKKRIVKRRIKYFFVFLKMLI